MSKTVTVRAVWHSRHEIEVADDFEDTGRLEDFTPEELDQISTQNAELVDWDVYGATTW